MIVKVLLNSVEKGLYFSFSLIFKKVKSEDLILTLKNEDNKKERLGLISVITVSLVMQREKQKHTFIWYTLIKIN